MKLSKEILRLAGPSILANITVPLVGMVDIAVVGHLGGYGGFSGAALIGGISVGAMLFDLLYWNFAFLRTGTGGLAAQAFGRWRAAHPLENARYSVAESSELGEILRRGLGIALLSGLVLILLQWVVVQLAFLVVQCTPEVRELATQYFYIRIWAAPATLSLFAFKGWFIGLQDSVRPMTADLLVNGINILLSVGLGFGIGLPGFHLPAMGFTGVALGTVIAQYSGCLYCFFAARRRYAVSLNLLSFNYLHIFSPANSRTEYQQSTDNQSLECTREKVSEGQVVSWGSYMKLNGDLVLRSVGMIAVYIGFTVISARYGDTVLAVSAILMKLLMIFSYFTDGFAYAGEALTGRFIGEQSRDGLRSTVLGTFAWSLGVAAFFMLLYGLGGVPLLRLMTSDADVVSAGQPYLWWLLLMPLIGCPAFVWDGIYIGATASKDLRNSTLLCAVGFFLVWFIGVALFHPAPAAALHLLMAAYFIHLAIRAVYLTLRYPSAIILLIT